MFLCAGYHSCRPTVSLLPSSWGGPPQCTCPEIFFTCHLRPMHGRLLKHLTNKTRPDDLRYILVFFSTFEVLELPIKGPMEDAVVIKLYKPSRTPCLYITLAQNIVGRVLLIPWFLAGNSTQTIPHMFSKRRDSGFPFGCADSAAVDGRRGNNVNVYEVNLWLW